MFMKLKKILPMELNYEIKNFPKRLQGRTLNLPSGNNSSRIFFLDAASYNNLGDQAIAQSMRIFLNINYPNIEYVEVSEKDFLRNFNYLKSIITEKDIICLSGGGNMGNLYPKYESIRRKIIKNFTWCKIIVFPQTIDYEANRYGRREMKRSAYIYNKHKNLIVCAREEKSYRIMDELYNSVIFIPDIVLYLNYILKEEICKRENMVGICLREDCESILSTNMRNELIKQVKDKYVNCTMLTTMDETHSVIDNEMREILLKNKLIQFGACKVIVTDRLHGMIFSILTGTPCVAIDNSNKKVSGVLEVVKSSVNNVIILKNPTQVELMKAIESLYEKTPQLSNIDLTLYNTLIEEFR